MQESEAEISQLKAKDLGLNEKEYNKVLELLGRAPNFLELLIYSMAWSEGHSYKNSVKWLNTLPQDGNYILKKARELEPALIDIGNEMVALIRFSHPSYPKIGSGSNRHSHFPNWNLNELFSAGSTPVGLLIEGFLPHSELPEATNFASKMVQDLSQIELNAKSSFQIFPDFSNNPISTNILTVGLAKKSEIIEPVAKGNGNPIFIIGNKTGIDQSQKFEDQTMQETEHKNSISDSDVALIANLQKAVRSASIEGFVVGAAAISNAGIGCTIFEMCNKTGAGAKIDLIDVNVDSPELEGWQIATSGTPGRMVCIGLKEEESLLTALFEDYQIEFAKVGEVSDSGKFEIRHNGELLAELPTNTMAYGGGVPLDEKHSEKPEFFNQTKKFNLSKVKSPANIVEVAKRLISSPNIAARLKKYQTDSILYNGNSESILIPIPNSDRHLLAASSSNPNYASSDPFLAGMIAVAEASRTIICSGGVPLAVAISLNYESPNNKEDYFLFINTVKGIGEACRKMSLPVASANVIFEEALHPDQSIDSKLPVPAIGMVGSIGNKEDFTSMEFKEEGDYIYMLGNLSNDICSSEYVRTILNQRYSPTPEFDMYEETEIQKHIKNLIHKKLIRSAHHVSTGGLFTCIIESSVISGFGFNVETVDTFRKDSFLFGESQSRVVITIAPDQDDNLQNYLINNNVSFTKLGEVFGNDTVIDDKNFGSINSWKRIYDDFFEAQVSN